jgi:dephospho-CoA kinase
MVTLTLVVGLPGSGKSHHSDDLARSRGIPVFHDVLARHLIPSERRGFCALLETLLAGTDCVANEICLVHEDKRATLKHMLHVLFEDTVQNEWVFSENDPEQCIKNVDADTEKTDTDGRISAINHYSKD